MSRKRKSGLAVASIKPLLKTKGQLEARSQSLSGELSALLGSSAEALQAHIEFAAEVAVTELQGAATEHIQNRNWGKGTQVAQLCDLGSVGPAWIGLREKWVFVETRGGRPYFAFESASVTIYAGASGALDKAQLMRAEWAGFANRGAGESFQAGSAGHPHWQIDLFETLRVADEGVRRFGEMDSSTIFRASQPNDPANQSLKAIPLERFHFASAAHWWLPDEGSVQRQHHTPNEDGDVSRWLIGTIGYIRDQLGVIARAMA